MDDPIEYKKGNMLQRTKAEMIMDKYNNFMNWESVEHARVLDVGCGTGDVTVDILLPHIPSNFELLLAVDLSDMMVEYAQKNFKHPKVIFRQMDIVQCPVDDLKEQFHRVFSFFCIQWNAEHKKIFSNIYNILKPGGVFLFAVSVRIPFCEVIKEMSQLAKYRKYLVGQDYISIYQTEQNPEKLITRILEELGFEINICVPEQSEYVYSSRETWINLLKSIYRSLHDMPSDIFNDFVTEALDRMDKLGYPKHDENHCDLFQFPHDQVIFVATKRVL